MEVEVEKGRGGIVQDMKADQELEELEGRKRLEMVEQEIGDVNGGQKKIGGGRRVEEDWRRTKGRRRLEMDERVQKIKEKAGSVMAAVDSCQIYFLSKLIKSATKKNIKVETCNRR